LQFKKQIENIIRGEKNLKITNCCNQIALHKHFLQSIETILCNLAHHQKTKGKRKANGTNDSTNEMKPIKKPNWEHQKVVSLV
jgi:hypothetical protein